MAREALNRRGHPVGVLVFLVPSMGLTVRCFQLSVPWPFTSRQWS